MNKKETAEIKKNFSDKSGFFIMEKVLTAFVDNEKNVLELLEDLNSDFKKGQYEKNSSGMNIDYIFGCGSFTTKEMSFKSALGGGE